MALSPINTARVSFNQQTATLLESLRRSSLDMLLQQNHLSSGHAFEAPSEDPAGAAQVLSLDEALGRQDQILENLRHAADTLNASDGVVSEVQTLLTDAQAIASQNVGSLVSADERAAAAELIADIVEQLVLAGNRQFGGSYLFAGRDTQNAPFESILGGVAFYGDDGDVLARVAELDDEPINLTGDQVFGTLTGGVDSNVDLTPRLTADTRIEDVLGALGERLRLGTLVIARDGATDRTVVDLSEADTMGDVVDLINDGGGGLVTAALTDSGVTLTPLGGAVTVTDSGTGTLAAGLGVLSESATTAAIGGIGLRRLLSTTTAIADLIGGAGIDLTGPVVIRNGQKTATLDFSTAETVQDVLNKINNAGLSVRAEFNADRSAIDVVNLVSGASLSIADAGGTTAQELGLRTFDQGVLVADLNAGRGIETVEGKDDIRITAADGTSVDVNLDGFETVGEMIDAINTAAADAGVAVTVGLAPGSSGLQFEDTSGGTGALSVTRLNLSYALDDLGLGEAVDAGDGTLTGDDIGVARTSGVLTAMIELEAALLRDDDRGITAAAGRIDEALEQINRAAGVLGARAKAMESRRGQTENAVSATQQLLSSVRDVDFAEAVTVFQQTQTALQATLLTGSRSMSVSLMNFLS
ncbi:MAG: hypothetical protein GY778_11270 [bacterium]|nr:hypothetical protein [bacterium]